MLPVHIRFDSSTARKEALPAVAVFLPLRQTRLPLPGKRSSIAVLACIAVL
jgi:hypothetical protein